MAAPELAGKAAQRLWRWLGPWRNPELSDFKRLRHLSDTGLSAGSTTSQSEPPDFARATGTARRLTTDCLRTPMGLAWCERRDPKVDVLELQDLDHEDRRLRKSANSGGRGRQAGGRGLQAGRRGRRGVSLSVAPQFPGWLSLIESTCNAGAEGSIPKSGRSSGVGNGNPLQYSCLENSMDRGDWRAAVHGVGKSQIRWSPHTGLLYQVHHLDDLYLFLYLFIFISLSLSLPHLQTGTSYPQALTFFQD